METKNRLIVVLGMHRSGTSAITRGLQVLGADFGSNLQAAMRGVNEKGFFEDNDVVSLNEEILRMLSQAWHTLSPITRTQLESEALVELKTKAISLLREKMQTTRVLAIKDPRVARLLPFWQDVFKKTESEVSYVIVIRHPLSVAESLNARDGFEKEKSCYLWLEHVLPSIMDTSGLRRVLVDYDNMMERPRVELARIANALGFMEQIRLNELAKYENEFLDAGLRHTKFDMGELTSDEAVPPCVVNLYQALVKVAADEYSLEKEEMLNGILQADRHLKDIAPALRYMSRLDWKIAKSCQGVVEKMDIVTLKNEVVEREERIAILSQAVTDRDIHIGNYSVLLADRDVQIDELSLAVVEKDVHLRNYGALLADRDEQIDELSRAVAEREADNRNYEALLVDRNEQIDVLSQTVAEKDVHLRNYGALLVDRNEQIDVLSQTVAEKDVHLRNYGALLADRDEQIDELSRAVAEREADNRNYEALFVERNVQIDRLSQTLLESRQEVDGIRQSWSFRLGFFLLHPWESSRRALREAKKESVS